jgi:hypothetical protein
MESGGGFTRKVSGGVDADRPIVARNPGTTGDADSSEEGPAPHPEVEISSSSRGRSGRALSRLTSAILEAEEPTTREGLTLDNLSSSMWGRRLPPLSRSMSTESVVGRLAPGQEMKEASPLNIGDGVTMGETEVVGLNKRKRRR